ADKQLADVVIIDIADQKAAGVALDMLEACPVWGSDARVLGTGDYAESANSDIVVVTSGVPRKPGMSRDDLLNVNYKIMQQVTEQVVKYSPGCIIIPVSNPLDAMAQAVLKLSKFPRERVIGMDGVRDLFVGVPCKLGARGLEKIIEIKLTPDEDAAFKKSAAAVKELVTVIGV